MCETPCASPVFVLGYYQTARYSSSENTSLYRAEEDLISPGMRLANTIYDVMRKPDALTSLMKSECFGVNVTTPPLLDTYYAMLQDAARRAQKVVPVDESALLP